MSKLFTVAIVPAKMTSQRFKRKNLENLCGQPLVYYSIQIVKYIDSIRDVFVSSEDRTMLETASVFGAKTIVRPKHLSNPDITTQDVLKHVYAEIFQQKSKFPDLVVLLQPTHPLRMPGPISDAIKLMEKNEAFDCLFSVMPNDELRGRIVSDSFVPEFNLPRDKATEPKMFTNTGSFYIFRPKRSFLTKSFFGKKIFPFVLERSPFEIDIDYPSDMEIAKCLLERNKEKFPHFDMSVKLED